ncbi:MAG: tRNA (adenosine(37)-N6)-threonylcarbamoyltransferase complex dimerization subunit type 1 TsaB [Burkholderiaceae bacterium]|jgi:tRNA threonylcarbamoyladenosine biosynthesis protein TsaB|nr:tRNA (adenosine(37)-N6)-threonylcarbamoyltransferase complex dimerization subunit type 1 TsaB [Burkholderiales bacterium]MCZ8340053.1 tRNA (adenosine(37)-N6)-threonylcarbamoyltransferase complex dimerization subunit type 1 TsaB [Burkholderiaceae bacterium]
MPFDPAPRDADRAGPTVLAIDTTAGLCSVALLGPRGALQRAEPMTHGHSRHVLGLLGGVLDEAGVGAGEVTAIGFGSGPGSFTGLRIACGVAQGLGFGWSVPLVPVDAMRTLALQASLDAPGSAARVLVALDLRMGEVCIAAFDRFDGATWPSPSEAPALSPPERAIEAFDAHEGTPLLAGDGFDAYPALGEWARRRGAVRARTAIQPDASAVARLALAGLSVGLAVDAARAAPTYLRDKVALDVGEQAALRAARAAGTAR